MHFLEEVSNEHSEEIPEEDHEKGILVVLAAFIILCVGALAKQFCIWSKFPYSPLLIGIGLVFGLIAEHFGELGESWEYISSIHPHLLLTALLPPLIFESSFSMSYHIFKKEFFQIILLAGPGILINALLTAVCVRFVFYYIDEFPFDYSFLFGAILAATDPVAVVALLKELGASKTLSHMIEGESLLNDGTALVLFEVLKEIVEGKSVTAGYVIWFFCRLSIGGPILGILFALVSSYWIGKLFRNELLEMVIIFITPYLCFYTAEQSGLQVSGVLALVGLGLYMANVGKTAISSESFHSIHTLWSFAGYAAETLIFALAGIIIGVKISDLDVELKDWLMVPCLYIAVHIIRIIIIALFYPLLKRGYGMNWRKAAILSYGGLRGAVGLAMALNIYIEYELKKEARDRILFFTASLACLTIWSFISSGYFINQQLMEQQLVG